VTRIWALSDLHQEFVRDDEYGSHPLAAFDPALRAPGEFDVVAVAGDVDVPLTQSLRWLASRFPGVDVLYTPGNHDFFNEKDHPRQYTMAEQMAEGRELAAQLGIHLLMNDTIELAGTRFVGATLWTDFMSVGPGSFVNKVNEAAGRYGMNDYRRIKRESTSVPGRRKRLRPIDTIAEHRKSRAYIEQILAEPFSGPSMVMTHHAPHPLSLWDRYSDLNFCYASNLGLLLESDIAPDAWLHGHIHKRLDYEVGRTHVYSNPRGYQFVEKDRDNGFDPALVIELVKPNPALAPSSRTAREDNIDFGM
jgi:hypothetical protein